MACPTLAFANTVQNSLHAIILLILLRMVIGHLRLREIVPTVLKILVATAAMVAIAWGAQIILGHFPIFSLNRLIGQFLTVAIAGGLAVFVYLGAVLLLRIEEISLVKDAIMSKFGRK